MRYQRSFLLFCLTLLIAASSHAYMGVRLGVFTSGGSTNMGGGILFGFPMPVQGLALEAELSGYYQDTSFVDSYYLQASGGGAYDINHLITPESDLIHPYLRAGLAYGFLIPQGSNLSNEHAPGFYSGLGVNFKLPMVTLGIEGNYNYINFDAGSSQDFWSVLWNCRHSHIDIKNPQQ